MKIQHTIQTLLPRYWRRTASRRTGTTLTHSGSQTFYFYRVNTA